MADAFIIEVGDSGVEGASHPLHRGTLVPAGRWHYECPKCKNPMPLHSRLVELSSTKLGDGTLRQYGYRCTPCGYTFQT